MWEGSGQVGTREVSELPRGLEPGSATIQSQFSQHFSANNLGKQKRFWAWVQIVLWSYMSPSITAVTQTAQLPWQGLEAGTRWQIWRKFKCELAANTEEGVSGRFAMPTFLRISVRMMAVNHTLPFKSVSQHRVDVFLCFMFAALWRH